MPQDDDLRPDVDDLLAGRFDENGNVKPVHPSQETFHLDMIVPGLARGAGDELTPADLRRIARALEGESDDDILGRLTLPPAQLPPVELARARRWLWAVTEAMREWVLSHLAGNPAFDLSVADQILLIPRLWDGEAGLDTVYVLLNRNDDDELAMLAQEARGRPTFRDILQATVPHRLGHGLDLKKRYPAGEFTPSMIDEDLADLGLRDPVNLEQLSLIAGRVAARRGRPVRRRLSTLPPKQLDRALWWLADIRVQLGDVIEELGGAEAGDDTVQELDAGLLAIDSLLNFFYSQQARAIPDAGILGVMAVVPPATQAQRLREALRPPAVTDADEGPESFVAVLPGESEPFRVKLARELRAALQHKHARAAAGRGEAEHDAEGALYEWPHIVAIAELARKWVNEVFGHLAEGDQDIEWAEPGQPGNLYDLFDYTRW